MPSYEWSCPACGHHNQAGVNTCSTCSCPSQASRNDMAQYRARHLASGGVLQSGAGKLPEPEDLDILKNAARIFVSLFAFITPIFGTGN